MRIDPRGRALRLFGEVVSVVGRAPAGRAVRGARHLAPIPHAAPQFHGVRILETHIKYSSKKNPENALFRDFLFVFKSTIV